MRYRWDIFCKVIDNFGDAGVCWRLARQLAGDFDQEVRLWIDDLATLSSFTPGLDCKCVIQKFKVWKYAAGNKCKWGLFVRMW